MAEFSKDESQDPAALKAKLKKKEAELKALEEKTKKELEEAEKAVERAETVQKIHENEEEHAIEEAREQVREAMDESLEDVVGKEELPQEVMQNITYMVDEMKGGGLPLYTITDYNFYGHLKGIREKVAGGEILSEAEQTFVYEAR